jgi:Uma2 family endonuclease
MSLIDHPTPSTAPPLVAGERLDRATFHNRYERTAPDFHAELIGGMVYVRSRVDFAHGEMHFFISAWLGEYTDRTPGTRAACRATLLLDDWAEPEPDITLRVRPEYGGQTRIEGDYLAGPPELVIEGVT